MGTRRGKLTRTRMRRVDDVTKRIRRLWDKCGQAVRGGERVSELGRRRESTRGEAAHRLPPHAQWLLRRSATTVPVHAPHAQTVCDVPRMCVNKPHYVGFLSAPAALGWPLRAALGADAGRAAARRAGTHSRQRPIPVLM